MHSIEKCSYLMCTLRDYYFQFMHPAEHAFPQYTHQKRLRAGFHLFWRQNHEPTSRMLTSKHIASPETIRLVKSLQLCQAEHGAMLHTPHIDMDRWTLVRSGHLKFKLRAKERVACDTFIEWLIIITSNVGITAICSDRFNWIWLKVESAFKYE